MPDTLNDQRWLDQLDDMVQRSAVIEWLDDGTFHRTGRIDGYRAYSGLFWPPRADQDVRDRWVQITETLEEHLLLHWLRVSELVDLLAASEAGEVAA